MNLTTIEMPVEEAKARLDEYRSLVVAERTAEDDAIAAGYRAAARGLPVIRLSQAIAEGGYFDNGLPRLAIARADATECRVRVNYDHLLFSDRGDGYENRGALVGAHTVRVRHQSEVAGRKVWRGTTIVPIIPPRFRPRRGRLRSTHVLWEVESWTMIPPKDPALLRHIRGDLWAVLAVWDLTDLERAVLAQRGATSR